MKRMRKYLIRTLLGVAAVVAAGFAATSCSDDSDSGSGVFRVEWDPTKTVHPDREGAAVLIVDGREGTSWRAEITAGADWVSFNRTAPGGQTVKTGIAGTSLAARNQYVYYWPNDTKDERHAMIRSRSTGRRPSNWNSHNTAPRLPTMSTRRAITLSGRKSRPGNPTMRMSM